MKFAWKIFAITYLIILLAFGSGGFLLVDNLYRTSLDNEREAALRMHGYIGNSYRTLIRAAQPESRRLVHESFLRQLSDSSQDRVVIGAREGTYRFASGNFVSALRLGERGYIIRQEPGRVLLQIVSRLRIEDEEVYIESLRDITHIYRQREESFELFRLLLLAVVLAGSGLLLMISVNLTRPIRRLSLMARQLALGDYARRAGPELTRRHDEIASLAGDFNIMADRIDEHVVRLKEEIEKRESFVGSFTHELKTPLTSVIGYADLLRSYDFPAQKRREMAEYIYKEGKRMEALSLHLLEIIVLGKQEIEKTACHAETLRRDLEASVAFLLQKYRVSLTCRMEPAVLLAEPHLLKTLLYNLIDNSCKASEPGSRIVFEGRRCEAGYRLSVTDNGKGIPPEDIGRVTEAFYMVDKSRAREQGGAGLGLNLCQTIARLHNTTLEIKSRVGAGTCVSIVVEVME